jgi:hypothetical protein
MVALLIIVAICFIATIIFDKKVFPKIYSETGKNPFTIIHKALVVVMGACMFLLLPIDDEVPEMLGMGIGIELACIAIFALLNLKYKEPKMIAMMTGIHAVYGIGFSIKFFIWIVSFAFNMGGLFLGQDWRFGSSIKLFGGVKETPPETIKGDNIIDKMNAEADEMRKRDAAWREAEKVANNEAAEAYAQHQGFKSADDAEAFGVKTGKRD